MNTRSLLITSLIGGLVTTALCNIPVLNLVNCLLCAGFWAGALLAVWLYRRSHGPLTLVQGALLGAVTGVWAGLIGFALSFFNLAGAGGLVDSVRGLVPPEALTDVEKILSGPTAILFNLMGVFTNIVLGTLGGVLGALIFKPRARAG